MLRKLFRPKVKVQWNLLEKDTVDEIIFRTANLRDCLLLELMARGAMRIGEVLKLTPNDIAERKLLSREPKSGGDAEIVFIPQKVADRLREYVRSKKIGLNSRIFPICYEAARAAVRKAGNMVGIYLRPTILGGMQPPLPAVQVFPLQSSAKSFSGMRIFQQPRFTLEILAIQRL
jgi:integrase